MAQPTSRGRWFKFNKPTRGLEIEAGHLAQVPLVVSSVRDAAQTGNLIEVRDLNTAGSDTIKFSVNSSGQMVAGARFEITREVLAASVDNHAWTCPAGRTARILAANYVPRVAGSDAGAVTLQLTKTTGTQAPTAGVALTTGTFDLKGTADTVENEVLTATDADRVFAAGNRLSLDFAGVLTAVVGAVTVDMVFES